jgi:hypothetical protein
MSTMARERMTTAITAEGVLRDLADAVDIEIEAVKSSAICDPRGLAFQEGRRWAPREAMEILGIER